MKKLLFVLFVLALPSVAFAQDNLLSSETVPAPKSALAPDIFHFRAHTCISGATNCGPDNLVTASLFATYIDLFVPVTQSYSRFYIVTDTEGNVVGFGASTSTLTGGTRNALFLNFALPPGLYKFISIVAGADGRLAFSDYYRFRAL